jgi:hypothetical protein
MEGWEDGRMEGWKGGLRVRKGRVKVKGGGLVGGYGNEGKVTTLEPWWISSKRGREGREGEGTKSRGERQRKSDG